jgi:hypothetical protein
LPVTFWFFVYTAVEEIVTVDTTLAILLMRATAKITDFCFPLLHMVAPLFQELGVHQNVDEIPRAKRYGISSAISSASDPQLGTPIIRMANISLDGELDLSDLRYIQ